MRQERKIARRSAVMRRTDGSSNLRGAACGEEGAVERGERRALAAVQCVSKFYLAPAALGDNNRLGWNLRFSLRAR